MTEQRVAIVDYGAGNLWSVTNALRSLSVESFIVSNSTELKQASHIILPGVGAFGDAMGELRQRGLDDALHEANRGRTPILAICLGMQMLLDESHEFGNHKGLGMIPGTVVRIPDKDTNGTPIKVPHIGWSELEFSSPLYESAQSVATYFVHSFHAKVSPEHRVATTKYGGHDLTAMIQKNNVLGCQFHPEKSGKHGLAIMKRFLETY